MIFLVASVMIIATIDYNYRHKSSGFWDKSFAPSEKGRVFSLDPGSSYYKSQ